MTNEEMKKGLRSDPELLAMSQPFLKLLYNERYENAVAALANATKAVEKLSEIMDILNFIQDATDNV